jgi:hypothetical protein
MLDIELFVKNFNFNGEPTSKSKWVSLYYNNIVHTRGVFPSNILDIRRTLPKEIKDYQRETYESLTSDVVHRSIDSISRTIGQSDYKMSIEDFNDVVLYNGEVTTFKDMHLNMLITDMLEDPNGYIYWMPDKSITEQLENEKVVPLPILVGSRMIKYVDDTTLVHYNGVKLIPSNKGAKRDIQCNVYRLVTIGFIYDLVPYLTSTDEIKYKHELYYQTDIKVPFKVLGGRLSIDKNNNVEIKYYQSYFQNIFSWANEFIGVYIDFKTIFNRMSSPVIQMKAAQCPETDCRNGLVYDEMCTECEPKKCGKCKGKGVITDISPYSTFLLPDRRAGESEDMVDVIKYITPPIEAVNAAKATAFEYLDVVKEAANITRTGADQSGIAKELDRQQKYDMLSVIIDAVFDLVTFSAISIDTLFNVDPNKRGKYKVVYPKTITITNETELQEIASNKSLPVPIQKQSLIEFIDKKYINDERSKELQRYIVLKDPYYTYSVQDLMQLKASGLTDKESLKIHSNINEIVLGIYLDEYDYVAIDAIFEQQISLIEDDTNPLGL